MATALTANDGFQPWDHLRASLSEAPAGEWGVLQFGGERPALEGTATALSTLVSVRYEQRRLRVLRAIDRAAEEGKNPDSQVTKRLLARA